jgi:hypothetical protein
MDRDSPLPQSLRRAPTGERSERFEPEFLERPMHADYRVLGPPEDWVVLNEEDSHDRVEDRRMRSSNLTSECVFPTFGLVYAFCRPDP